LLKKKRLHGDPRFIIIHGAARERNGVPLFVYGGDIENIIALEFNAISLNVSHNARYSLAQAKSARADN